MGLSKKSLLFDEAENMCLSGGDIIHDIDRDSDWSFSIWFKTSNTTSQQAFFGKTTDWSGYPHGWQIGLYPPGVIWLWMLYTWSPSNQLRTCTSTDWADGDWHHLVFTHDTSISGGGKKADCKCYVDGVLQALNGTAISQIDTLANNVDGPYDFRIGDAVVSFPTFDGNLDEAAIYKNKVLNQTEVDWIYNGGEPQDLQDGAAPSGLHAWWRLGETLEGQRLVVEETAEVTGYSPLTESIKLNDGVTDQHVEFPSVPAADFDFTDSFSFGIWVKAQMPVYDPYPVAPRTDVLFIKHRTGGSDSGYAITADYRSVVPASPQMIFKASIETATPGIWWSFDPGWWANVYSRVNNWWDGTWRLIVVTWNGVDALVWIDGQRRTESQTTSDPYGGEPPADGKLFIGNHDTGSAEYCPDTNVCHAFIYDKTLNSSEIRAIYGEGVPQDLSSIGPTSNLKFWSALGDGDAVGASNVRDLTAVPAYSPLTTSLYLQSDAQSETIQFASPLTIGTSQPFTMGVWIKRVGGATERTVMCKCRVGGEWDWMLRVTTNAIQAARQAGSSLTNTISQTSVTWNDGDWHLLLVTYDGSGTFNVTQVLLYWDGAPAGWSGAGSSTESRVGAVGNLTVGGLQTGPSTTTDHFYQANVCHSFLYDKELSAAEVTAIYGGGVPQDLSSVGPTANLVHWSALGDGDAVGAGNMIDLSTSGIDGTFVNGESDDFVADVPLNGSPGTFINGSPGDFVSDVPSETRDLTRGGADSWWNGTPSSPTGEIPSVSNDTPGDLEDATTSTLVTETENAPVLGSIYEATVGASGIGPVNYLMRGVNAGGGYVHWRVSGSPDLLARFAPETIPNLNTVTIAGEWI